MYAFGGNIFREGVQEGGGRRFGLVYFDPARGEWARAPAPPRFRRTSRTFALSGGVDTYPIDKQGEFPPRIELPNGGSDGRRVYWFSFLGPIFFDGETGKWARHLAALFVFDKKGQRFEGPVPLYRRMASATADAPRWPTVASGGLGQAPRPRAARVAPQPELDQFGVLASLEVYDPAANTYTERAPMHQPRWLFAASFGPDGMLYAFGGFGAASGMKVDDSDPDMEKKLAERSRMAREALRSVEAYDPETNTWTPRDAATQA